MTTSLEHIDRMIGEIDGEILELPTPALAYLKGLAAPSTASQQRRRSLSLTHDILESLAERMSPMYDYNTQVWHVYRRGEGLIHHGASIGAATLNGELIPASRIFARAYFDASLLLHDENQITIDPPEISGDLLDTLSPRPSNEELFGGDLHQRDGGSE